MREYRSRYRRAASLLRSPRNHPFVAEEPACRAIIRKKSQPDSSCCSPLLHCSGALVLVHVRGNVTRIGGIHLNPGVFQFVRELQSSNSLGRPQSKAIPAFVYQDIEPAVLAFHVGRRLVDALLIGHVEREELDGET
jgi:hypothetical protein